MSVKRFCFVIILPFVAATFFTAYIMLPAIDQNSSGEYCVITARLSKVADRPDNTYIKIDGQYRLYKQEMKLNDNVTFYIQREGAPYSIHESNWVSQARLCKLRHEAVVLSGKIFAFSYVVLTALTFGISFLVSLARKGSGKIYKRVTKGPQE